jgi:hypothetical protein
LKLYRLTKAAQNKLSIVKKQFHSFSFALIRGSSLSLQNREWTQINANAKDGRQT